MIILDEKFINKWIRKGWKVMERPKVHWNGMWLSMTRKQKRVWSSVTAFSGSQQLAMTCKAILKGCSEVPKVQYPKVPFLMQTWRDPFIWVGPRGWFFRNIWEKKGLLFHKRHSEGKFGAYWIFKPYVLWNESVL